MKPPAFDYFRAESLEEAAATLWQAGGDARVLAGGQSLLPMLNMRLARPGLLVDITRIAELKQIQVLSKSIVVPAAVRQAELGEQTDIASLLPLVAAAIPHIGHVQTRSSGTVCGSIAHADPSAELPLCLVALQGQATIRSRNNNRSLPAEEFFTGLMSTALGETELLETVSFPRAAADHGYAFQEVARRRGDFAIVSCAAIAKPEGIRLAVGGVSDVPVARDWPNLDGSALSDALNQLAWDLDARDDLHASARYRRELVRTLGRKTIMEARACRGE